MNDEKNLGTILRVDLERGDRPGSYSLSFTHSKSLNSGTVWRIIEQLKIMANNAIVISPEAAVVDGDSSQDSMQPNGSVAEPVLPIIS